ncbi:MAG TPA: hypothetical protein VE826_08690 [Dongiaceae bacterium]|nr:hypothetical protein [Dongiaceae bacterium]
MLHMNVHLEHGIRAAVPFVRPHYALPPHDLDFSTKFEKRRPPDVCESRTCDAIASRSTQRNGRDFIDRYYGSIIAFSDDVYVNIRGGPRRARLGHLAVRNQRLHLDEVRRRGGYQGAGRNEDKRPGARRERTVCRAVNASYQKVRPTSAAVSDTERYEDDRSESDGQR